MMKPLSEIKKIKEKILNEKNLSFFFSFLKEQTLQTKQKKKKIAYCATKLIN